MFHPLSLLFYVSSLCFICGRMAALFKVIMILNIVTSDAVYVLECLRDVLGQGANAPQFYLKNRPAKNIIEIEVIKDGYSCISLENLHEALPFLADYDIRILI